MKKWIIGLVLAIAIIIVGAPFAKNKLMENVGLISRIKDPIGPNREVEWKKGPETARESIEKRPPNVVFILADDLGANDVTFGGGGVAGGTVPTPHIDSIAEEGVYFTNGYAGNATCAPSRASILTGRYATRFGFEFTPAPKPFAKFMVKKRSHEPLPPKYLEANEKDVPDYKTQHMPLEEITLAELLKDKDYHSVMLGKWHLGGNEGQRPGDQGFDEFLGFLQGSALYAHKDDPGIVNAMQDFDPVDIFQWNNLSPNVRTNEGGRFEPDGYLTDYLADEAVKVIEKNKNRPFFMYLSFSAPHTPLQATKEDYDALSHIENHTLRVYAAMIRALDRGIGRVLDSLEENGLEENTIVVFSSDNGGADYLGLADINKPYRGWKMTFFEGGVHVPFYMKWPAGLPKGKAYPYPVMQFDVFATAAAAAGIPLPADRTIDGVDLSPYINGQKTGRPHDALFWRDGGYQVVLAEAWKLQVVEQINKKWLFNLDEDPTEQVNLAEKSPEKVKELQALLDNFNRNEAVPPLWPTLIEGPARPDKTLDQPWDKDDEYVIWSN